MPIISAIICTHNRADLVTLAIQSLFRQTLPVDQFEIIVVNNASTDNTEMVIARLAAQAPKGLTYRYIHEGRQGLSHARNAGVAQARGRYVAFLDDDGIAVPGWLQAFIDTFALSDKIGAVGGPISAIWMKPRPQWISDRLAAYFSVLDLGTQAHRYCPEKNEWLGGGNLAVLRSFLANGNQFSTRLGRTGKSLLSNEETHLLQRIVAQGLEAWYQPAAGIDHHVHAERVNRIWLLRRCFWQGVSNAVMAHADRDAARVADLRPWKGDFSLNVRITRELLKDWIRVDLLRRNSRMDQVSRHAFRLGQTLAEGYLQRQRVATDFTAG